MLEPKNSNSDLTIVGNQSTSLPKPRGLVMAISEIQQYSLAEKSGEFISQDFLTLHGKITFFSLGLRSGLISNLIIMLFTLFSIGVMNEVVPIFGKAHPDTFDKIFAMLMAVSFSLGYAIFLATTCKYYLGELTKACVRNLLWGATIGTFIKMMIAVIFFHFMYLKVMTQDTLSWLLLKFYPFVKYDSLNLAYEWLLDFRPTFLTSAYFTIFVSIVYVAIPWFSILAFSGPIRKRMERMAKWRGKRRVQ